MIAGGIIASAKALPYKTSNLAWWLDGEDSSTVTLTSGLVSQWNDKSGNNYHFVQTDSAKRPSYSSSGILAATNTQQHLINTTFTQTDNYLFGIVVGEQTARGSSKNVYGRWISLYANGQADFNNLNGIILTDVSPNNRYEVYRNSATQAHIARPALNTKMILGFRVSGGNVKMWRDGGTTSTGTTSTTSLNSNRVKLFVDPAEVDSNIAGYIYEVIFFKRDITDDEVTRLITYLSNKWSI